MKDAHAFFDAGLMIIWLLFPRFTVFAEIGTSAEIFCSKMKIIHKLFCTLQSKEMVNRVYHIPSSFYLILWY